MIFPYLSLYILIFAFICFILFIICPYPHGKFSLDLPLSIPSDVAWAMINLPALICIFGYWDLDRKRWVSDVPSPKGWVCLTFFIVHFIWRGLISVLLINTIHSENNCRGEKKTSFFLVLASWFYYPVVGMLVRYMCVNITDTMNVNDFLFLVCCVVFLFLNAYVDIMMNYYRKTSLHTCEDRNGRYLTKGGMREYFTVLFNVGIESPNYFFEIIEWGFFAALAFRFEALWWFVATILILLPRSLWTSHWMSENFSAPKTRKNRLVRINF